MKEQSEKSHQINKSPDRSACLSQKNSTVPLPINPSESEYELDSGFNTMEACVNPLEPQQLEDDYMECVLSQNTVGKASTMAQLVMEMNKVRVQPSKKSILERDAYDHVDLRRVGDQQPSIADDAANIYGDLSLQGDYENILKGENYCNPPPIKPKVKQKPDDYSEVVDCDYEVTSFKVKGNRKK